MRAIRFKGIISFFIIMLMSAPLLSFSASANAPAWPDIIIKIDEPYDGDHVVAVLSDRNAFNSYEDYYAEFGANDVQFDSSYELDLAAMNKIHSEKDEDGYDYIVKLDPFNKSNGETEVDYFVYETFKIAIYYPDSDTLVKTGILKKEDYIEVFRLTMDGKEIVNIKSSAYDTETESSGEFLPAEYAERQLITGRVMIKFLICLAVNLVVELLIALLFGYRKWQHILCIAATNIVTLILLTLSVMLINPPVGNGMLSFPFAFFEIAVAAIEAGVYLIVFRRIKGQKPFKPWLAVIYAAAANAATYLIGSMIYLLPYQRLL